MDFFTSSPRTSRTPTVTAEPTSRERKRSPPRAVPPSRSTSQATAVPFTLAQTNSMDLKTLCVCVVGRRSEVSLAEERAGGVLWDFVTKSVVLFGICSGLGTDTQQNDTFQQINTLCYLLTAI